MKYSFPRFVVKPEYIGDPKYLLYSTETSLLSITLTEILKVKVLSSADFFFFFGNLCFRLRTD